MHAWGPNAAGTVYIAPLLLTTAERLAVNRLGAERFVRWAQAGARSIVNL